MTKARDIADFKFENIVDTGTEGTKVATGTTAQRGSTAGQLRFNTTTGLAEYYTGSEFKAIDTPPLITSVDVTNVETDLGGTETFVISGSLFSGSATVKFRDNGGTLITPDTTTVNSSSQITVTKTRSSFSNANEPYDVIVTNPSGLDATLDNAINVDNAPVWSTASGSLGTVFDGARGSASVSATATDPDGDTITYSVQSGSLPTGANLNSSTGAITGFSAVVSDTTSSFTLRATAGSKTADRAFSITVKAPVEQVFSYTGSNQTFTVPTGLTSLTAYMWGAGGGGGHTGGWADGSYAGGGGSSTGTIDVSSISSLIVIVGQGGEGQDGNQSTSIRTSFGGGAGSTNTTDNQYGGGGGGLSGIFNGSYTHANSLLIAGGGGGGGSMNNTTGQAKARGGAGGGTTGQDGSSVNNQFRGFGGTQSAGGAGGSSSSYANGSAGSALQGGSAGSNNYGGGGGGGYYGGSAGSYSEPQDMGGGGGGSGYAHPTLVSNATLYQGLDQSAGNSSSSYRNGAGNGGNYGTTGANGRVVIVY
jgi:hypothetical protein